jgi:GT2 family glycosyltransferase
MKKFDYGVVILNYNVSKDAILAAQSVINNAESHRFIICLADNASSKEGEVAKLETLCSDSCEVLSIKSNWGYARGNNEAIRFLLSKYDLKYIIVMNPDVLILNFGTIDRLLNRLAMLPENYCGIQPLVWTPYMGDARCQNICQMSEDYGDILIGRLRLLKLIFRKKYNKMILAEYRPYTQELDFETPCGAFFIIKTDIFQELELFDERTFLYGEERIIGYKVKERGYKFLLLPSEKVQHEGGKSTGSNAKCTKWHALKIDMESVEVYIRYYLHRGTCSVILSHILTIFNWGIKRFCFLFKNPYK